MSEVEELLSGVQERLTERLGPIRSWLFPPQVYLQLEDEAITAMALEGRRITWLERVPLPMGLCEQGEPLRLDSLGDLLGDLFVERGYAGARVDAVLPPAASQMRLVQWPDGRWPEDPERTLALNDAALGLRTPLQYLDLHLVDLPRQTPTSLLVTVPSATLDRWIEVFSLAQVSLERMEAAKPCFCRGLLPLLSGQQARSPIALLHLAPKRSGLLLLEDGVPVFERRLAGADDHDGLVNDLTRFQEFWASQRSGRPAPLQLVVHGPSVRDEAQAQQLAQACQGSWRVLDPLADGWLSDASPDDRPRPEGCELAALWGLAAAEVMA